MAFAEQTICIATRGSALALAQSNNVLAQCRAAFPELRFEIKIIKTTGDKLQAASLSNLDLPKGLFTKELETALLNGEADLAVHSLKDLPTELPNGLKLGAVSKRADIRDVLLYRDAAFSVSRRGIPDLPRGATVATSSTRRSAQLLDHRPDLKVVPIRGNVGTRLKKLAEQPEMDATILAAAGLERLHFQISADGKLSDTFNTPSTVPAGLRATFLEPEEMLPCVGQAALGIEIRENDARLETICARLNEFETQQCVTAERAFLRAMGGGCQLAVAAYAEIVDGEMRMRAVSFLGQKVQRGEARRKIQEATELGQQLAAELAQR